MWMVTKGGTYIDPVISVRVLRLFRNNEYRYIWYVFLAETAETMYNLSVPGVDSGSLIGCLYVTFSRAPNFNATDSLDGAYLGPFKIFVK